jgi:Protein of unknown function (DUF1549)/Protein of unknown function (DUF1553)
MRGLMRVLTVLAVLATAGRPALAEGPDAAELAAQIDRLIETRLGREKIRPAEQAGDAEFLRRVYLDLHGVVPSAEQAVRFLDNADPAKRARLINTLLGSPRYGEYLADIWQKNLVSPFADERRIPEERFRQWLADRFNSKTWDRITLDLLTASGTMEQNPAVVYLIEGRHPRSVADLTDLSSRYFLGIRLNCAQCHDHPFVKWTRQDYWGLAAFFTQIQTPGRPKVVYRFGVKDDPSITLASLRKAGMLDDFLSRPPTYLGGEKLSGSTINHRQALARWVTSPKNPWFARAMVNRMWWHFFGRGIVQPVDDMHAANPASHPELLELLRRRFVESGFDLKFLCRAIVLSRAYQRTSRPGDNPEKEAALFARRSVKVLSAGQLYDSLVTVLGSPARTPGVKVQRGSRQEFMQFFAQDGDLDPTSYRRGIPHLLRLMNSRQFAGRNLSALVDRLEPGQSVEKVTEKLFLTIVSRRPTADEQQRVRKHLSEAGSPAAAYRELAWALIVTSEFSLNH